MNRQWTTILKWSIILLSLVSIGFIIHDYGVQILEDQFSDVGLNVLWLLPTFLPTLILYGLAWMLVSEVPLDSDENFLQRWWRFSVYQAVSIAWNNLTPFLKFGGEPIKYIMLSKHLSKTKAMQSTISYNFVHLLSTALSFALGGICITLFFPLDESVFLATLGISILFFLLFLFGVQILLSGKYFSLPSFILAIEVLRVPLVGFLWSIRQSRHYYRKRIRRFAMAITCDTLARFVEGLTFYFAFWILGKTMQPLIGPLLDVFRTLIDTLLFFVPYQLGGREEGIRFAMENIFSIGTEGFLWLSLSYRFVEIFWTALGYLIWIFWSSSSRVRILKSA